MNTAMRLLGISVSLILLAFGGGCDFCRPRPVKFNRGGEFDEIRKEMRAPADVRPQEGIAAAILFDASGSMKDPVRGLHVGKKPKIEIAREAVVGLLGQFGDFAAQHPDRKVLVGVYEFSTRKDQPECRTVVKLGPPDVVAAAKLVQKMVPDGGTPIGDSMIVAQRDLEASGMTHRHLLVVSDGESNRGFTPGDVTRVIGELPENRRSSIYFIAFDVNADLFDPVKNAGGLVLAAGNEQDLRQTLDYILTGKILVEQPSK
jgi:Mg-chelatase subunit ChlD